jgi:hypothetical protein
MSVTGGRRPALTRGVFAIEQEQLALPDPLALDTSFVVEALLATQPLHATCSAFLASIVESGVAVVTSDLLAVELAESAFAITLKERWGGRWRGHRTDGRSRRPATQLLNHTVTRYEALLSPVNHLPIPVRRVTVRRQGLDDRFRHRVLRRRTRGQRHRRRRRGDRHARHRLRAAALCQLSIYTDRSRLASCRNKRPH